MIRRPPRSTHHMSSAASDVYKRQTLHCQCSHSKLGWKAHRVVHTVKRSSLQEASTCRSGGGRYEWKAADLPTVGPTLTMGCSENLYPLSHLTTFKMRMTDSLLVILPSTSNGNGSATHLPLCHYSIRYMHQNNSI